MSTAVWITLTQIEHHTAVRNFAMEESAVWDSVCFKLFILTL